eukprot:TRINITY_DN15956_c0_g1_i1.p1 TRINITY_DN15956_c0_g1~~TRINITY_DN15956_c0_g1_i1.p1  ORF type:complete len:211 (+),score=22.33 TRINITY_DN15956_c0_g1_i1:64-633(+)
MSLKCVTPPTNERTREAVGSSETPVAGGTNQYYCPVCMMYFGEIGKTTCCGNYLCEFCVKDVTKVGECVSCPFCITAGVKFTKVDSNEGIKTYKDSPAVMRTTTQTAFSPIPPGASFDEMKKKVNLLPDIPRDSKFETLSLDSRSMSGSSDEQFSTGSIPSIQSRSSYVDDSSGCGASCSGKSAVCVIS